MSSHPTINVIMSAERNLNDTVVKFVEYIITKELIKTGIIEKEKVHRLFLNFQKLASNVPEIGSTELITALQRLHFIKNPKIKDVWDQEFVEFKEILFKPAEGATKRIATVENGQTTASPEENGEDADVVLKCEVCKMTFRATASFQRHQKNMEHVLRNQYRENRRKFQKHIPNLKINGLNDRALSSLGIDEEEIFHITFENVADTRITYCISNVYFMYELKEIKPTFEENYKIENGDVFKLEMKVNFKNYGYYLYPIIFEIKEDSKSEGMHLLMEPTFSVLSNEIKKLAPVRPFAMPSKQELDCSIFEKYVGKIVRGEKHLDSKCLLPPRIELLEHHIPDTLKKILFYEFRQLYNLDVEEVKQLEKLRALFCDVSGAKTTHNKDALNTQNYVKRFRYLLWMEELEMYRTMSSFNRSCVQVEPNGSNDLYRLQMSDLSEGRPSVLRGDKVLVTRGGYDCKFEGIVHRVEQQSVCLSFGKKFTEWEHATERLDIEFLLDRLTLKYCHRALDQIDKRNVVSLLFPVEPRKIVDKIAPLKSFHNKSILTNSKQITAVTNIVRNTAFPAPYILFGPPGTGKTATIVEAITQLYFLNQRGRSIRICVCAPSNSAADLITERLLQFIPARDILRIYGLSRSDAELPKKLKICSNYDRITNELFFPSKEHIFSKSIVVLTPITAGRLVGGGIEGDYFNYLFMDEAGHAIEPEMIVPIVGLLTKWQKKKNEFSKKDLKGSLILAGDPKQLGPVIQSSLASHLGLDMSLLERLMTQCELYKKNPEYDDRFITKLLQNYRSHNEILKVPNLLFYENELIVSGPKDRIDSAYEWVRRETGVSDCPVIFHGVTNGREDREENSPSYFNIIEIQEVGKYVKKLVHRKFGHRMVHEEDIGIITPYRKQVQKLRRYLNDIKMPNITVASVEEFQGQERLIIIITTVRSRRELVDSDYQYGLGFLSNAKRFNVAVTRAVALLIVVGNPNILQCDPNWRALIEHCRTNGTYDGNEPDGEIGADFVPTRRLPKDLSGLVIRIPGPLQTNGPTEE